MLVGIGWTHGREAALLVVLTVVASDSSQYYAGRLFGRTPLAPAISPKKTIEGAIGGLAGGALVMAWLGAAWLPTMSLGARAGLGLVLVAVGIVGDLLESAVKRAAAVKDSSHIIPGHGGVLDRIDALLLVVPVYGVAIAAASRWGL
jgi:phosphatidate cytidylyltransferase